MAYQEVRGPIDILNHFFNLPQHLVTRSFHRADPGLVALYFVGSRSPYYKPDREHPIWIGSGENIEARRRDVLMRLYQSCNLNVDDFRIVCFPLNPLGMHRKLWLRGGAPMLIDNYAPEWNTRLKGFASHVIGGNRSDPPTPWGQRHLMLKYIGRKATNPLAYAKLN